MGQTGSAGDVIGHVGRTGSVWDASGGFQTVDAAHLHLWTQRWDDNGGWVRIWPSEVFRATTMLVSVQEDEMQPIPKSLDTIYEVAQQLRQWGEDLQNDGLKAEAEKLFSAVVAVKQVIYRDPTQP